MYVYFHYFHAYQNLSNTKSFVYRLEACLTSFFSSSCSYCCCCCGLVWVKLVKKRHQIELLDVGSAELGHSRQTVGKVARLIECYNCFVARPVVVGAAAAASSPANAASTTGFPTLTLFS